MPYVSYDTQLWEHLQSRRCETFTGLSFPNSSLISFEIVTLKQTLFKCNSTADISLPNFFKKLICKDSSIYYTTNSLDNVPESLSGCSIIHLPKNPRPFDDPPFGLITATFDLLVRVSKECKPNDEGKLDCVVAKKGIKIGITQQYLGRHIYIHSFMKLHTFFFLFLFTLY
jgi:hypothetical protein